MVEWQTRNNIIFAVIAKRRSITTIWRRCWRRESYSGSMLLPHRGEILVNFQNKDDKNSALESYESRRRRLFREPACVVVHLLSVMRLAALAAAVRILGVKRQSSISNVTHSTRNPNQQCFHVQKCQNFQIIKFSGFKITGNLGLLHSTWITEYSRVT